MNREILRLAIPNILSNLSVPLLGLVDTILMGHEDQPKIMLAGVGIATAIFNVIYWSFGFLRMGTTGLTAQAFGKQDEHTSLMVLLRGLLVAIIAGFAIMIFQAPIGWMGLKLMEGSPEAFTVAESYFNIRIYAAPATLALYVLIGWFLGRQNAVFPMILAVVINLVNIVANLVFVQSYGLKEEGIALGTLIAQYTGLLIATGMLLFRYRSVLRQKIGDSLLKGEELKRFLLVNRDIFIRTACLVFTFTYFTSRSGSLGDELLAANQLLLQLLHVMSYIVDGFAFAAESLVGRYYGENSGSRLAEAIRKILLWGMGFGLIFSGVYLVIGPTVLQLLTDEREVVGIALEYLPWMILMPVWGTFAFMWDGIYIGATATVSMRNTMLLSSFLVFLPVWWLTSDSLGNHGLWLAMTAFMVIRGISLAILAPKNGLTWKKSS